MDADPDTLATAPYVTVDDTLRHAPNCAPGGQPGEHAQADQRRAGLPGGHASPAGLRLRGPLAAPRPRPPARPVSLPGQAGYNKRLRAAFPLPRYFIRALASDSDLWADPVWVADSTPVEYGRSRVTVRRSALAGWAAYGYCRSHTRWFWGAAAAPGLYPVLHGLPVAFALANPKADERAVLVDVLVDLLEVEPGLAAARPGLVVLADKGYRDAHTEQVLAAKGCGCCGRPSSGRRHAVVRRC